MKPGQRTRLQFLKDTLKTLATLKEGEPAVPTYVGVPLAKSSSMPRGSTYEALGVRQACVPGGLCELRQPRFQTRRVSTL